MLAKSLFLPFNQHAFLFFPLYSTFGLILLYPARILAYVALELYSMVFQLSCGYNNK